MKHQDLPILKRLKAENKALTRTEQSDPGGTFWNFDRLMIPLAIAEIERLSKLVYELEEAIHAIRGPV